MGATFVQDPGLFRSYIVINVSYFISAPSQDLQQMFDDVEGDAAIMSCEYEFGNNFIYGIAGFVRQNVLVM